MSIQKNPNGKIRYGRSESGRILSGPIAADRLMRTALAMLIGMTVTVSASAPAIWKPLFDGRDLLGWGYTSDFWSVDAGLLKGQGKATFNTFCHTDRKYSDFVLTVKARLWQTGAGYTNSGLQYRSDFIDSATHRMKGYQVDIGDNLDGAMYPEGAYPADAKMVMNDPCAKFIKHNDWNQYLVTANGGKIRHELNGNLCLEYTATVLDGYIGLQLHATSLVMKVDFKDLFIRPLNNSFLIPESQAATLDESFSPVSLAPRALVRNEGKENLSVTGNTMYIPASFWSDRSGPIDISLRDFRGRTVYSRPVNGVGEASLSIALPALEAGGHILSVTGGGNAYAGVFR